MSETDFVVDKDKLEVTITRVFNATPERLWQAYTQADQIVKWWSNTKIDILDFKVGGTWRFVGVNENSGDNFKGEFVEIEEPKKIVRTFEYEPYPGHGMTESVTFEPQNDTQTKVTTVSKYNNIDDLEGMVGSGMKDGSSAGLDRLAKLIES